MLAILLLLLVLVLVFSIPAVQTKAAHQLTEYLNSEFHTDIQIKKIKITYDAKVDIKGVYIGDHHQDTLISAESIKTSLVNIPGLLSGKHIDFGDVTAKHLTFRLRRYKGDEKDSFGLFLDKLESDNPDAEGSVVWFKHLNIIDSKFSFVDEHNRYPDIVSLENLNIDASNFKIHGGDISLKINSLEANEKRGLKVDNLTLDFDLGENHMNFDHFDLKTPNSRIKARFHFSFDHTMADFENKVQISANFKDASVATSDLQNYYDEFGGGKLLNFHGKMKGTLNDFELQDFSLNGLNRTAIDGNIALKNVFGDQKFRIDGNFNSLETNYTDLVQLLPHILRTKLPEALKKLGEVHLAGRLSATKSMVSTNATIHSAIGQAKLDVVLSQLNRTGNETYKGKLQFDDFDWGQLLNNPKVGKASFEIAVEGKGFESNTIDSELKGTFSSLVFNGYTYHNIDVNGVLKNPVFIGKVISHDPNLKMNFNGQANVTGKQNNYDFTAQVDYADLHALNFEKKDSIAIFKGDVKIIMKGHNIDDVVGNIELKNSSYQNRKGTYDFKELYLNSSFEGDVREISINSPDIINGKVRGHFVISEVPALFKNAIGNLYSNYKPIEIEKNQYLNFDISIHNKIVQALFPDISLDPDTSIKGKVRSSNSNVKLIFKSPEIKVLNNAFENVNLQLDNTNPLFTTYFDVDSVSTSFYDFSRIHVISKRVNDTLFIRSQFKGGEKNNDEFNFNFYHTIDKDNKSVIGVRRSNLKFKDNTWLLNKNREEQTLVFDNNFENFKLDTLVMSFEDEAISFSGIKRASKYMDVNVDFSNVDLDKVTPSIKNFSLKGVLNGKLEVNQKQSIYYPSSDMTIKDFGVNDVDYGDLNLDIRGNKSLTSYRVNATLSDDEFDYMTANGEINVGKKPSINLDVDLKDFKIGVLNAFGDGVISNVRGTASGHAHVGGSYKEPAITGQLNLKDAGLEIPYLNVDMAFEDNAKVKLLKQEFYFDHVNFEDTKYHTKGMVNGSISHHNFRDWQMDLNLLAPDRLLVLDTEYSEDALYYGTAFISGNAHIRGPFNELVIDVNATSEKGTVFKIPLNDTESIGNNEFIYFLTPEDKQARKKGEDLVIKKLKGLELNFDLDVTEDAEVEIVVDKKSGSTLQGKGAGTLLMEINTNGKFNMWGDFVVYKGTYNFKYAGLIEKKFEVVPGGSITWDGSPTRANLNVRALYQTQANPASLLENPTINRSIPVNVYIDLKGLLANVDISFKLEYPNLSSVVKSELEYRINERNNNEIQALSLITQGTFYSEIDPSNNTHPENLLYERAANLFDDIFSNTEDKFKVGVNYTKGNRSPEQEIADRVGVTLSTNISDRVLINGRVGVPIGGLTQSVVVGNVEIEFLLNDEGTLRAKVFNRESDIQYIGEELGYTQGVGISYSVDFDTFKELIHKILNKQMSVKQARKEVEKDKDSSLIPDYIDFPN